MNSSSNRMALYGWPAVAVITVLSSLYGILFLPQIRTNQPVHSINAARIKYLANVNAARIDSDQTSEIHAFLASDLFASSRTDPMPSASNTDIDRLKQFDESIAESPLFLSFPLPSLKTGSHQHSFTHQSTDNDAADLPPAPRLFAKRSTPLNPMPSIRLHGDLSQCNIKSEALQALASRQGKKAWFADVEVQFNNEGLVDFCLVESTDCDPSLRQEVINAIYQCRLLNAVQPCGGRIEIMFPAYHAKDNTPSALTLGRISGSK